MKTFLYFCALLLAFCGGILCTSCRTAQPVAQVASSDSPQVPSDSLSPELVKVDKPVDKLTLLDRLLGRQSIASSPQNVASDRLSGGKLRKCKGCTIINAAPGATVTTNTIGKKATAATAEGATATSIGKAKAPVVQADSGASVQVATAKDQAAAGQGISQQHEETKQSWLAAALPWVGGVGAVALVGWLLFGGGGATLLALWRRNKSTTNQS